MMLRQAPKAAGLRSTYEEQGMFDKLLVGHIETQRAQMQ